MTTGLFRLNRWVIPMICWAVFLFGAQNASATDFTNLKRFVFGEATSLTLLKSGEIDFSTALALDDDVEAELVDLDAALDPPTRSNEPRYAIILDVFMAKASRRVLDIKGVPSTVFLGFQGAPFSVAADDPVQKAQGFAALNANRASQNMYGGTPQAVGQPVILSYTYDTAQVQARRRLSAHIYLIDRVARTYIRSTVDVAEEERFEIAYRVSRYDPRKNEIHKNFDTEKELDDYEQKELLINLSDVLKDFQSKAAQAKPFKTTLALHSLIRKGQTKTLASLEANRFDARPLNDPRFDSVVAIYTGKGSLGSGFYVTSNVIMTNWHVVKGQRFVEMKAYDGQQTFGTVLGHDARLDIALVKVERRGRPVAFYTGRNLNPGSQVEAIGHPLRMEFTITRGVVSAIRKHYSINLPKRSGGEDVLFVQTDAPINPGNSGGPLFLGNRVVGMNTWGRRDGESLGFSVHYSELLNFINEHLVGFNVDPAGRG